ncbi:uncharacterized protein METZ01_LOCUS312562, partial [marine metagenome]
MTDQSKSRLNRIREFLNKPDFNGFTSDDLFIMTFIKKGWGQGIVALSNMAEAISNLSKSKTLDSDECSLLIDEVIKRSIHKKVRPYKYD